jgi:Ca2+-binding EF-hand superfamily protein
LDSNRDGQLTFSEAFANPQISNNFNLLDTNADGLLSRGEVFGIAR